MTVSKRHSATIINLRTAAMDAAVRKWERDRITRACWSFLIDGTMLVAISYALYVTVRIIAGA